MSETLRPVPSGVREGGDIYKLREPTIEDIGALAGVIGRGADDPDTLKGLFDGKMEDLDLGSLLSILMRAIADPQAREDFYFLLADMWTHDPTEGMSFEEPPEEWDYEPREDLVKRGQLISREEMWRSLTKRQKKRIVKRYAIGALSYRRLKDLWDSLSEVTDIKDFLNTSAEQAGVSSGSSTTVSSKSTAGQIEE